MKFLTAKNIEGKIFIGVTINQDKTIVDLNALDEHISGEKTLPDSLLDGIYEGESFLTRVKELLKAVEPSCTYPVSDIEFLPPLSKLQKNILCVGKNYREHAIEMGSEADIPTNLIVFTKAQNTLLGHRHKIPNHQDITQELDYEGELAIIIGKKGKSIKKEEAYDYIFGYTILNDITARDIQSRHKQYFLGKSLDGSCPIGPWIVHKSTITNPEKLYIETKVNGEVRQSSYTSEFIFSIGEIIETISKGMTLEPGDIIATGTPQGVGKGFNPPKFLRSGDMIEVTIEGIGTLVNEID